MCMTIKELTDHTANVRCLLEAKQRQLPGLNGMAAAAVCFQIYRLIPRVEELEQQCAELRDHPTD